jgi:hypothetical protein
MDRNQLIVDPTIGSSRSVWFRSSTVTFFRKRYFVRVLICSTNLF